jgi:hypothetical protein
MYRLLIMVDKPAFVDAFPVLRMEFPICIGLHRGMVFFPADKAFHQSRLLINHFCRVLLSGHILCVGLQAEIGMDCGQQFLSLCAVQVYPLVERPDERIRAPLFLKPRYPPGRSRCMHLVITLVRIYRYPHNVLP